MDDEAISKTREGLLLRQRRARNDRLPLLDKFKIKS